MIRNDPLLMNYPASHRDITKRHFWMTLFGMTDVICSQATEELYKEGIHCPHCINSPVLGTLWCSFCGMCLSPCWCVVDVCVMNPVEINSVFPLMNIWSMIYLSTQTWTNSMSNAACLFSCWHISISSVFCIMDRKNISRLIKQWLNETNSLM